MVLGMLQPCDFTMVWLRRQDIDHGQTMVELHTLYTQNAEQLAPGILYIPVVVIYLLKQSLYIFVVMCAYAMSSASIG